jgi:hypothetical protein
MLDLPDDCFCQWERNLIKASIAMPRSFSPSGLKLAVPLFDPRAGKASRSS